MTPQGGPHSAGPMPGYPSQQSPMGAPAPAGRGYQGYGGQGGPGMAPQGYGQMPPSAGGVPGSAGGYGRPDHMQGGYGGPPSAGAYPPNNQTPHYGGYQT